MLKQAQILAKVKCWTVTVAATLCSNLCVCFNFLALEKKKQKAEEQSTIMVVN